MFLVYFDRCRANNLGPVSGGAADLRAGIAQSRWRWAWPEAWAPCGCRVARAARDP